MRGLSIALGPERPSSWKDGGCMLTGLRLGHGTALLAFREGGKEQTDLDRMTLTWQLTQMAWGYENTTGVVFSRLRVPWRIGLCHSDYECQF